MSEETENKELSTNEALHIGSVSESLFTQEQFDYVMNVPEIYLRSHLLHQVRLRDNMEAEEIVRNAYEKAEDKRLIIFDGSYPWRTVLVEYPEPLFVISYKKESDTWRINAIPINPYSYENRKNLPKEWAGLRDSDLREVTGVEDAIFCHNGLFLAVAKSKEGVLKLGKEALK